MSQGFMDLRQWIALLEKQNELRRVRAEVDWDREIGAVSRRALEKKGPALLSLSSSTEERVGVRSRFLPGRFMGRGLRLGVRAHLRPSVVEKLAGFLTAL